MCPFLLNAVLLLGATHALASTDVFDARYCEGLLRLERNFISSGDLEKIETLFKAHRFDMRRYWATPYNQILTVFQGKIKSWNQQEVRILWEGQKAAHWPQYELPTAREKSLLNRVINDSLLFLEEINPSVSAEELRRRLKGGTNLYVYVVLVRYQLPQQGARTPSKYYWHTDGGFLQALIPVRVPKYMYGGKLHVRNNGGNPNFYDVIPWNPGDLLVFSDRDTQHRLGPTQARGTDRIRDVLFIQWSDQIALNEGNHPEN